MVASLCAAGCCSGVSAAGCTGDSIPRYRRQPIASLLMLAQPARRFHARSRSGTRSRSHALFALASIGFLCWPMMCGAQMVGPTPQPQGIPVTPEQAEQIQPENWAIHGQSTFTWLLQPAFRSPYQGPQSLSPAANGRETFDATLYAGLSRNIGDKGGCIGRKSRS